MVHREMSQFLTQDCKTCSGQIYFKTRFLRNIDSKKKFNRRYGQKMMFQIG